MNIKIDPTFSKDNQDFNKLLYEKLLDIYNGQAQIEMVGNTIFLTVSDNGNDSVFRIDRYRVYVTAPG